MTREELFLLKLLAVGGPRVWQETQRMNQALRGLSTYERLCYLDAFSSLTPYTIKLWSLWCRSKTFLFARKERTKGNKS